MIEIAVCPSGDLIEGGKGVRFPLRVDGEDGVGFVIRFDGVAHGYLNRCAHIPVELDWSPGEFMESSGLYIMCATHGAIYQPDTGHCTGGPCRGGRLRKLQVSEHDGQIYWQPDENHKPAVA